MLAATCLQINTVVTSVRQTRHRLLFQVDWSSLPRVQQHWVHKFLYTLRLALQPSDDRRPVWKCQRVIPDIRCIFKLDSDTRERLLNSDVSLDGCRVTMLLVPDISPAGIAHHRFHVVWFSSEETNAPECHARFVSIPVEDIDMNASDIIQNICWKGLFDNYLQHMGDGVFDSSHVNDATTSLST